MTVEGGVKKMKIARIICWPRDSTLRPTPEARIWYHSGLTAGIDMTDDYSNPQWDMNTNMIKYKNLRHKKQRIIKMDSQVLEPKKQELEDFIKATSDAREIKLALAV